MRKQYAWVLVSAVWLALCTLVPGRACAQEGVFRTLFVACEDFLSQPSMAPSSSNNVSLVSRAFASGTPIPDSIYIQDGTVATLEDLRASVHEAFAGATQEDVSLFYLSTHGVYDAQNPRESAVLLLSDGQTETPMTAQELRAILDEIPGTKFVILDACNSGAFIGKGMETDLLLDSAHAFSSPEYKVLTSCGGMEQSWYWDLRGNTNEYGSSYFAIMLSNALFQGSGCPADVNRDGAVTLSELYEYMLRTQPTSTAQVYPQNDDSFVVFMPDDEYAAAEPLLRDISFGNTVLSMAEQEITFSYTVTRPVRVLYQLVYTRQGVWDWQNAQLFYDDMIAGGTSGLLEPGRVERTISLGGINAESSGYALLQLIAVGEEGLDVYEGRLLSVQPIVGNPQLRIRASASFSPMPGRELLVEVTSDFPTNLTMGVYTTDGTLVRRLAVQRSMRPLGLRKETAQFYWDGLDRNGDTVEAGFYTLKTETLVGGTRYEATLENVYVSEQGMPVQLTPIG